MISHKHRCNSMHMTTRVMMLSRHGLSSTFTLDAAVQVVDILIYKGREELEVFFLLCSTAQQWSLNGDLRAKTFRGMSAWHVTDAISPAASTCATAAHGHCCKHLAGSCMVLQTAWYLQFTRLLHCKIVQTCMHACPRCYALELQRGAV